MLDGSLRPAPSSTPRPAGPLPTVWRGLSVYGIQLDLGVLRLNCTPGDVGDALRGLLGRALFEKTCVFGPAGEGRCASCRFSSTCDFTRVFRPQQAGRLAPWWLNDFEIDPWGVVRLRIHFLPIVSSSSLSIWLHGLAERACLQGGQLRSVQDVTSGALLDLDSPCVKPLPFSIPADKELIVTTPDGLVSRHASEKILDAALHTRIQRLLNQYGDSTFLPRENGWRVIEESVRKTPSGRNRRRAEVWNLRLRLTDLTPAGCEILAAGVLLGAGGETASGRGRLVVNELQNHDKGE